MRTLIVAVLAFLALHTPAYAYLDPGTGSMILQAIIGGVAVGAATISVYWKKLISVFSGRARDE